MNTCTCLRSLARYSFLTTALFCLLPGSAWAALNGYATVEGEVQGFIQGGSEVAPHEGKIVVKRYSYGVNAPYDPATGIPDGGRQHRPVRILKEVDQASPLLFNAMAGNETLTQVYIEFYQPGSSGAEEFFYSVLLTNAHVVSISPFQTSVATDEERLLPQMEWIGLTFEKIFFSYTQDTPEPEDDIVGEDNWQTSP